MEQARACRTKEEDKEGKRNKVVKCVFNISKAINTRAKKGITKAQLEVGKEI